MISTQAGLHILVNVGILPVTGHTLPLISLGGTSFVIFSCAFGIILSVSRTIDIDAAKQEEERIRLKELQEQKEREKRERELLEAEKSEDAQQQTDEEPVFHDIIDEQTGEFK